MNNRGYPNSNMNSNSYSDSPNITKVSGINPYNANNITLVLKVDNKSSVRTYNNNKGEGKMFSVDLVDDTGEIKCTFFNEGVDQYDPLFEVGKVFRISRAGIKAGNPKFCRTKYEMNINRNTVIVEERSSVPLKRRYNFVASIDSLQDVSPQALVDTIGVIYEIGDVANFNSKDGKELVKRSIRIADSSNRNIEITLWGDLAQNFSASQGSVLAIKNGKVNEFKGEKNISTVSSTLFEIDPEIPESIEITNWYSQNAESIATSTFGLGGGSSSQTSTSSRSNKVGTIAQLLEQAGSGDRKAVYVKVKGTITWINHDDRAPLYYKSCPDNNKKVIENTTGHGKKWLCEATGNYYDDYNLRYILSANVDDTTGSQFVTIFNDHAEFILGCEAKSIESYKDNGDSISLNNIFEGALFKRYFITIKATEEMYQDEMKLRCIIQNIESLDYIAESKKMIDEISEYII